MRQAVGSEETDRKRELPWAFGRLLAYLPSGV
jgi:hypothetical protein